MQGLVSVRIETWERLRHILANRHSMSIDDKTVMLYILKQGKLYREKSKYGVFFDIEGENVILEF